MVEETTYFHILDELHMIIIIQSDPFTNRCVSLIKSAVSVFVILAATTVQAGEWRVEPLIGVGGDFDDNAILTTRTDVDAEISGYIIDASAKFAYQSETTKFFITPRLSSRDYGDPEFDSDDQFLRFDFDHDTKLTNFRIRGSYDRESVRTSERADTDLDIDDPDEIPDDDTGRVFIRGLREKIQVKPSWTYRLSNISSFTVAADYRDVQYDEAFLGLIRDYTDARINLTYARSWSPRNTAILTATYRQFEDDIGNESTGAGFNAGIERSFSETTRLRAVVGLENIDQGMGESDAEWVADVSLTRRLQTITMLAQYKRTVSGGGSGALSSRDSVNLSFTRRLSELISAGLGKAI